MQRTDDGVTGDDAVAERPALVRTLVVDGKKTSAKVDIIIDVPAGGDDQVWSMSGLRHKQGNATVTLIGVPNFLSLLPEHILVPRETVP